MEYCFEEIYGKNCHYKYIEAYEQDNSQPVINLLTEMLEEGQEIMKSRNVRMDKAAVSVIKEQNQKWNKLARMFEKGYGFSPIVRDGLLKYEISKIPEIKDYLSHV